MLEVITIYYENIKEWFVLLGAMKHYYEKI